MKVSHNVPLAQYTTLRVGGPARTLVEPTGQKELLNALKGTGQPFWVLGFGANCLISDKGLSGTVILNRHGTIKQASETRLVASSGTNWDDLVLKAIELDLFGLEFTSGIPGGVGAAIAGNIAAYGQKVADRFVEATMLDTNDGSTIVWHKQDLQFDYRTSRLQKPGNQQYVVLDVTFEFSKEPTGELEYDSALKIAKGMGLTPDSLEHRRQIIMETRKQIGSLLSDTNKGGHYSAGSFFKNPIVNEKQADNIVAYDETGFSREQMKHQNKIHSGNSVRVSAAHVLLAAGFKRGQTWGNVRLHPHHILKLENTGKATAQEIYDVVQMIIETVKTNLNITLEPEVRFLGDF